MQILTICKIYQKEKVGSAREIAIKEDLELYEEINNKDRLISSLKSSPLLEISDPQRSPKKNQRKANFPELVGRLKTGQSSEEHYLEKIKNLYP